MLVQKIRLFAAIVGLLLNISADASELVIGQVVHLDDPNAAGPYLKTGLQVCFDAVNQEGGVHGARLKFVVKKRGLKKGESVLRTRELLQEADPLVLTGLMGTGPMEELVKSRLLSEAGIPVVGIRTGAVAFHEPVDPYLFHTRASYLDEIEKILTQLTTLGLNRVALFHEKSAFGEEGVRLVERVIKTKPGMQMVGRATYMANTTAVDKAAQLLIDAGPQSIIVVAASAPTADFYKAYRQKGGKAQVLTLSVADPRLIVQRIGAANARGLIVAQVVPDPANKAMPLIRELYADVKKYAPPGTLVNQTVVEGYLAGRVLVQALRMAGPHPTRQKVRDALESMKRYDAGGVIISFSPDDHTGLKYVDLAILLASGRLMR